MNCRNIEDPKEKDAAQKALLQLIDTLNKSLPSSITPLHHSIGAFGHHSPVATWSNISAALAENIEAALSGIQSKADIKSYTVSIVNGLSSSANFVLLLKNIKPFIADFKSRKFSTPWEKKAQQEILPRLQEFADSLAPLQEAGKELESAMEALGKKTGTSKSTENPGGLGG